MSYADENIIKMMNQHKSQTQGSINEGIYVKETLLQFHPVELFQGKMKVMLPETFQDMRLDMAKLKYPMEQRPQVIKTSDDTKINFTFSLIEQPMTNEQVGEMTKFFKNVLKNGKPDINILEEKIQEKGNLTIGWFDFVSNGYDQKIYNLMYFVPINGKMMHGIFNCPIQDGENWKPIALQVMQTIEEM